MEDLAELRVVEPVALHADKQRLLGQRKAHGVVLGEERLERRVERDRPLPASIRSTASVRRFRLVCSRWLQNRRR